ncbi:hypothetical protein [Rhizobium sp. L1K21]|uniref:hypothetical protein n=1 Tax=Rhizobium sp. L1K21 TaxID=2954933 RepID=UPI002092D9B9|nr:hypothetical protein [Rhizobium sp. L1K21]MCO6185186.1 hypothetical protein [Rhizobium sp. L1K21]
MSRFEIWTLALYGIQAGAAVATLVVALAALTTWKRQIDYATRSEVVIRTQKLLTKSLDVLSEARDADFFTFLDERCKAGYFVNEDDEPFFWAIYSTYYILNEASIVFGNLDQATSELEFLCGVDISTEVRELKSIRHKLMTASLKAARLRFRATSLSEVETDELEMHQAIIFSSPSDNFGCDMERLSNEISRKLRSAFIRPLAK